MRLKKLLNTIRSPRAIMSIVTLLVLALMVFLSRHELYKAWKLLEQADLWLIALLIPFQIVVYYAGGEMIFSYLRDKKLVGHISRFEQTRIALELNLVNHIFPSGGVSGISYTTWRMHKLGVSTGRSTFAQVIRYVMGFLALMALLIVAVLVLALDGQANRYMVASSFLFVLVVLGLIFGLVYMFSSKKRLAKMSKFMRKTVNRVVRVATLGKQKRLLQTSQVESFFAEMRDDFEELAADRRLLIKPFLWGVIFTIFDVAMFIIAFWPLGVSVNPAIILIGYGVAGLAGLVAFTPGGAGVYEMIMIIFLSMTGVPAEIAIAGIVLTRAILLAGTIIFGYIFYQHALIKYGKRTDPIKR